MVIVCEGVTCEVRAAARVVRMGGLAVRGGTIRSGVIVSVLVFWGGNL
jgi:hypothetical protein